MKNLWIALIVVALPVGIIGWRVVCRPNLASWPRCEYFRCVECGESASIDPDEPERWGCRKCGFSTLKLGNFRLATRADCNTETQFLHAMMSAGTVSMAPRTLASIYREGGGKL